MASARLPGLDREPAGVRRESLDAGPVPSSSAALALAAALLLLCVYAAFAHGAVSPSAQERVELLVAVIAAGGAAAWLWNGSLRVRAPAGVYVAVVALGAFALWSGVTLAWSVAPDQTWSECNRAVTYVIVLVLAIAAGASHPRALAVVGYGFLAACLAVTAYALGQKLAPGLHIGGLLDLDQTSLLPRLQEPFGYWNALALFIAMGIPVALSLAMQPARSTRLRLGALAAIVLMLQTIAFTYSRGGVIALVVALAVAVVLSGSRLRGLLWLSLAVTASLPALVIGLLSHPLTAVDVGLAARERAGAQLAVVLAACLLLLVLAGTRLIGLERRMRVSELQARRIGRVLWGVVAAALIVAVLAVTLSPRGLGGTVSHAWQSFTATRATSVYDPGRLLSADSENRWVWWKEAAGAFSDRPFGGWGAGSFGVVHLLYRRDTLSVQQPHSVPLQFLAETGIVGALLALAAAALLLRAGVRAVRGRGEASARLLAAALLAGAVAYAVHELYDWDWDIFGVTLPVLLILGTLVGSLASDRGSVEVTPLVRASSPGRGIRVIGLVLAGLCLVSFAASVVIPRLAASRASEALLQASTAPAGRLSAALATALDASRLDPLSDAGLKAAATIAVHRGDPVRARRYLLAAVGRDPTDGSAWQQLAVEDLRMGADREGLAAAQRATALDPEGRGPIALARAAVLGAAPPGGSASATPTPRLSGRRTAAGGVDRRGP